MRRQTPALEVQEGRGFPGMRLPPGNIPTEVCDCSESAPKLICNRVFQRVVML